MEVKKRGDKKKRKNNPFGTETASRPFEVGVRTHIMHGAAKKRRENFQSIARYCSSNGSCMGGQPARGLLHSTVARGHSSRGFIWSDRKHRRGAARHRATRISWLATNRATTGRNGEREIDRDRDRGGWRTRCGAARGRTETRMRSGEGRLRDEDMHINRETSTEMSDHRE